MNFEFGSLAMLYMDPVYLIIILATLGVSALVSNTLKRRFREYSQVPVQYTGAQIAQQMLRDHGITDVKVVSVPGHLSDHYNPAKKTVNLSEMVYHHNSVAAAAVAAHECGHAVQHQKAYLWLTLRSKLVPITQISSNLLNIVMFIAVIAMFTSGNPTLMWVWVGMFGLTTLFAFITLPVEFDASKRALKWLEGSGSTLRMEHKLAKNALFWAAMTYVVGAIGSLAMLAYYVLMLLGRRN